MNIESRRRYSSVQTRISIAFVVIMAAALASTGFVTYVGQSKARADTVNARLLSYSGDFHRYVANSHDHYRGSWESDPDIILRDFLASTVLPTGESEFGALDGRITWVGPAGSERHDQDAEFAAHVLPISMESSSGQVTTATSTYRYRITAEKIDDQVASVVHSIDLSQRRAALRRSLMYFSMGSGLVLGLVTVGMWFLTARMLRPLEDLRQAAEAIDGRDLGARLPVSGTDDLARVGSSFNRMLDRLEEEVVGQRQFLDDVGHELRTPVTIIRGHLELVDANDPEDVHQTRELALDELDRMNGLLGDLLMVAKARDVQFLKPAPVTLATLTGSVFEKATALGPRNWRLGRVSTRTVVLDAARITQAWLQLAANAVRYSDEGSTVTLAGEVIQGEIVLSVYDEGVGVDPGEAEAIRNRATRGSNATDREGAGLGLAIVTTIAEAHGGELRILQRSQVGTVFQIAIPLNRVVSLLGSPSALPGE